MIFSGYFVVMHVLLWCLHLGPNTFALIKRQTGTSHAWVLYEASMVSMNLLWPRQNGCHFAANTLIFSTNNFQFLVKISLNFVPKDIINRNPPLFQIMFWRQTCDKPLSEPMIVY